MKGSAPPALVQGTGFAHAGGQGKIFGLNALDSRFGGRPQGITF
jgi:hypothetical protein